MPDPEEEAQYASRYEILVHYAGSAQRYYALDPELTFEQAAQEAERASRLGAVVSAMLVQVESRGVAHFERGLQLAGRA